MRVCTADYIPCKDVSTKDTPNDVAKVRDIVDIGEGTGYQDVALSLHWKSGDQNDRWYAYNPPNQAQGQDSHDSHWMFLLCRLGGSYRTSGEDISSSIQFCIAERYISRVCMGLEGQVNHYLVPTRHQYQYSMFPKTKS